MASKETETNVTDTQTARLDAVASQDLYCILPVHTAAGKNRSLVCKFKKRPLSKSLRELALLNGILALHLVAPVDRDGDVILHSR